MKKIRKSFLCLSLVVLILLSFSMPAFGIDPSELNYKISGYIMPDISTSVSSIPVVYSGTNVAIEGTQFSASTDEKGYFEIPNVPGNSAGYNLKISKPNYLARYIDDMVVTGDVQLSTESAPITIWPGDIQKNGASDGAINLMDVMSVATAFNTNSSSPRYVKDYDLNLDGAINMTDILVIAKYFNKSSSNYLKYFIPLPMIGSLENLKSMLSLKAVSTNPGYWDMNGSPIPVPVATPAPSSASRDYSTTNNQVEGVDEADVVQTDGEYIYQVNKNRIIVAKAYPANDMSIVKVVTFSDDPGFMPSEMLMGDKKLIVIGTSSIRVTPSIAPAPSGVTPTPAPYYMYSSYNKIITKAIILDISDKTNISKLREIDVEGTYLSSRKIGSFLYLVANKTISYYDDLDSFGSLKPAYRDTKVSQNYSELGYSSVHYFPEFVKPNYMTIAGVNVDDITSKAFVSSYLGAGQKMYVSQNNIYIAETNYFSSPIIMPSLSMGIAPTMMPIMPTTRNTNNTLVYKFSMENGNVVYSGKGEVPGNILNQFSMDEYDGYFRIATTVGNVLATGESTSKNNLYIMDGKFNITGKIEGIAPGEKIYSTRFLGNRGYMVTFKKTDPLFVFDLKDPTNPVILGQLKIPGYSDYLHPYDENHVIGFGKDTVESTYGTFAWYQGMKIALFDITDVNNPVEKFKEIIGDRGTDSELLYNHKALMFSKSKNLMAFPVTVMTIPDELKKSTTEPVNSPQYGQFTFQGAYVYNIDLEKGFQLKGRITHIPPEDYLKFGTYYYRDNNYVERAMYINDTLYTLSKGKIKANQISDLTEINTLTIPQTDTSPKPTPTIY